MWVGSSSGTIEFHVIDVSAGDILYIPAGYGHQIVTAEERSIAMSFWWDQTGVPAESVLLKTPFTPTSPTHTHTTTTHTV